MTTGATGQLGLALPVQGELSGTWGDTVNNGTTQYTNIAIAATLTLTNDGAVTLANTTGDASASNIVSTLTGAGTVTAQFAIVRVTGTLTTAKVVTAPSYSKTYTVVNAATGGIVTFKASGQTGVSIAVGESAFVYFNGTDYVKVSGTSAVSSFSAGTTGLTPSTATTGAVTLAGTLATANGGTNLGGATPFTSGGVVYASSSSALATGSGLYFSGTNLGVGTNSPIATQSGVDISSGGLSLIIGADNGSSTRTNAGNKSGRFAMAHYTNAEEPFAIALCDVTSTTNELSLGGGSGACNTATVVKFFTAANNTTLSGSERMRIDSSGNVGIGTSSPNFESATGQGIHVNYSAGFGSHIKLTDSASGSGATDGFDLYAYNTNGYIENYESGFIIFRNNGSERMRLDASGNLCVGTTVGNYRLNINGGGSSGSSSVYAQFTTTDTGTANTDGMAIGVGVGSSPNANFILYENAPMLFFTNSTEKTRISAAGGFSVGTTADPGAGAIYATGNITAYYSDARLKTVSGKIENALDKVAQLSGVYYTNNSVAKSFGYDSDEVQVGVLAQDVEAVLPQIVKAAPFDLDENGNSKSGENYKTVQYERLVPLLIEAINELQAKVKALESK